MTRREKLIRQVRAYFTQLDEPKQIIIVRQTAKGYFHDGKKISENTLTEMKENPLSRVVVLQQSKPLTI